MLNDWSFFFRTFVLIALVEKSLCNLAKLRLGGGRIISSSTLRWEPGTGRIPEHAIPVTEDDVSTVWCRAEQHGTFVGGSFHDGVCTAPFLDQVLKVSEGYDILVSINGSARVERFPWDMYSAPPKSVVASSEKQKQFLAFHAQDDGIPNPGYLIPNERRLHIVDGEKVRKYDEGFVLAELEPTGYELNAISLDPKHTLVLKEEEVLQETELSNRGTATQRIVENSDITVEHLVYWGQVKGTLVGRKASIITQKPEEEQQTITWGVQNFFDSVHSQYLEYDLPPGTATKVKVIGIIRKTEAPYFGTLTAFYSDGASLSRVIEGLHMDERLLMLKAIYSPPYFIHNNTEIGFEEKVHVLYKSTTTTTTTTTTTSTTTTTPEPPWVSMVRPEEPQPKTDSLNNPTGREVRDQQAVGSGSLLVPLQTFILGYVILLTAMLH